jgi:hypothetical protein
VARAEFVRLDFRGGVDEYHEVSDVPEGFGVTVQNWVPEQTGSLRTPRGWLSASATGQSGTKIVRGIHYYVPAAGPMFVYALRPDSASYSLWYLLKASLAAGTWVNFDNIAATTSANAVAFAAGAGVLLYCTPTFPSARIREWNGTAASEASTDAIAGRALAYHNNRFFTGGATANPTYLRWSELGDSNTWTVGTNFQPLGQDDGEPIEDMCTWDRGLFVGKENSIWYVTGFGPDTFGFHLLDGGGVAPGRTLVSTPSGVIAIGKERVWSFQGGGFEPISQPIETSYGMTGTYMSGAYIDGCVYVCDGASGQVWVYDLATKAWHTEVYGTVAEGPGVVFAQDDYLTGGMLANGSTNGVFLYRRMPGTARARVAGSAMTFTAKTGEFPLFEEEPVAPSTLRNIQLSIRQRGGTSASTPLTVKLYGDGTLLETRTVTLKDTAQVFRAQVSGPGGAYYRHQVELSQVVGAAEACVLDIESAYAEIETEKPR